LPHTPGSFRLIKDYMSGYYKPNSKGLEFLVSEDEGKFIRDLRWKGIRNKIG
jgi:hypothetical protein